MASIITIPSDAIIYDLDLDLHQNTDNNTVKAVQYDKNKRYIIANIWNNGIKYPITTTHTIEFCATKPSGFGIDNPAGIDSQGRIIYQITEQTTAEHGVFWAEFRITDALGRISPFLFKMAVERSALAETTIISAPEVNILTQLIEDASKAISDIGDISSAESLRVSNENTRITNENTRKSNETTRVSNENTRKTNETDRNSKETTRQTNETNRVSAESTRNTNENTRKTNETNRGNAETTRSNQESTRQTNETSRINAETGRVDAENIRNSSEETRISSENTRKTNETNRVNTESSRVAAENTRVSNENIRESKETIRNTNEDTRKNNEADRILSENTRVSSEGIRSTNESNRQSQETSRQNFYNAYKVCEPYSSSKPYIPNNKVIYQGGTYQNVLASTGVAPTFNSNNANWICIAAKGADGTGVGDMIKSVYDPQGKELDVYDYADTKATYSDKLSNASGTFITSPTSDNALVEITKIDGETEVIPADPLQDISPDNVAELKYAEDFEVVSCGKNLLENLYNFNNKTGTYTSGGANITYVKNADGTINVTGNNGTSTNVNIWYRGAYIPVYNPSRVLFVLKAGTYALQGVALHGHYNATDSLIALVPGALELTADFYVNAVRNQSEPASSTINKTYYPQLELGTTATPYEPYQEDKINISYPFMSLPNGVKNSIEVVDGKLCKVERVGEVVLDGSEAWTKSISFNICDRFILSTISIGAKAMASCLFSHFEFIGGGHATAIGEGHLDSNRNLYFNFSAYNTTTLAQWKAWLSQNPVTVQYELATPIITPISPIYLKSYKGITHLYTTSDPQVSLTANFKSELWADTNYPKGNLKDATVDFTQATEDAELISGSKMSGLFGLIKKKFADILVALGGKIDKASIINNDITGGIDKVSSAEVAKVHGQEIDAINNNLSSGEMILGGKKVFIQNTDVSASSWGNSSLLARNNVNSYPDSRAGIAFENEGIIGIYLFLDTDGQLKFVNNGGEIWKIETTRIV